MKRKTRQEEENKGKPGPFPLMTRYKIEAFRCISPTLVQSMKINAFKNRCWFPLRVSVTQTDDIEPRGNEWIGELHVNVYLWEGNIQMHIRHSEDTHAVAGASSAWVNIREEGAIGVYLGDKAHFNCQCVYYGSQASHQSLHPGWPGVSRLWGTEGRADHEL